jgi:hypothetical protein
LSLVFCSSKLKSKFILFVKRSLSIEKESDSVDVSIFISASTLFKRTNSLAVNEKEDSENFSSDSFTAG